ncbi:MAG TPA: LuxR C-terminal-related transcriptional regulator [Allosphingosinicella sp.]|jgi:DNA-binding CsgD family transcriptional regulator
MRLDRTGLATTRDRPAAAAVPQPPNGAGPALVRFMLAGHAFVAVPRSGNAGAVKALLGDRGYGAAVGRINCSGTPYTLYEAEPQEPGSAVQDEPAALAEILTRRELQIALLISDGRCDKEIARHLGISGYTVREHIRRMFAKLKIARRSAIVAAVMRQQVRLL